MSTIDLMLLGVVMQHPVSAYELKRELEVRNVQKWIRISSPAVYKNFLRLNERGYVDGTVVREGEMPEKKVYSINEKGHSYFVKLMQQYAASPATVYIDFAAVISNLHNVNHEAALLLINQMKEALFFERDSIRMQAGLEKDVSFYGKAVVNLYERMYDTFCSWIEDFEKQYQEQIEKKNN